MRPLSRYLKTALAVSVLLLVIVLAKPNVSASAMGEEMDIWYVEYYDGVNLAGPVIYTEKLLGPSLETEWHWGDTPQPEVPDDLFSARFTILTTLPESGNWAFHLGPDDGARMYINGVELFDINGFEEARALGFFNKRVIPVNAGVYEIVIEYYDILGDNGVEAYWEYTTDPVEQGYENLFIPNTRPFTAGSPPLGGVGGGDGVAPQPVSPPPVIPEAGSTIPDKPASITDLVVSSSDFDTLEAALVAAGLATTLDSPGAYTVFAPTDAAFEAVDPAVLRGLLSDPTGALKDVLRYHVVSGEVPASDVVNLSSATTVLGEDIAISTQDGGVFLNGNVRVIRTDIFASNGVIHVIDAVLVPTGVSIPAPPVETPEPAAPTAPEVPAPPVSAPSSPVSVINDFGIAKTLPTIAVVVDESNPVTFIWSGSQEWRFEVGGATNNAYAYTDNSQFTLRMYGRWNLYPPSSGSYEVFVYIPTRAGATTSALYRVFTSGVLSDPILVNQQANAGQWVSLGVFDFVSTDLTYIYLNDLTFEQSGTTWVLYDSVAFAPIP